MSPKAFAALALATVAAVALAGWSIATRDVPLAATTVEEPLFPDLAAGLDQAAVIEAQAGDDVVTIRRDGEIWRVEQQHGFPADPERVRAVARGLAALEIVEAKTAAPDRLARLELEEPGGEEAKGRRLTLKDASGAVLASAILGKARFDVYGGGRGGLYVRRADESQAWLAAGEVDLPADAMGWVDTIVVDLTEDDMRTVTLNPGSADPIVISRASDEAINLSLDRVPEGRTADAEALARIGATLSSLAMQDVRPASAKPVPADAPAARFETRDGRVVTLRLLVEGEGEAAEHWAALSVEAPPAKAASEPAAAPAVEAGAEAAATDAASATASADASAPAEGSAGADPAAAAAKLAARVDGWTFKLPRWITERLLSSRDALLVPVEPPAS